MVAILLAPAALAQGPAGKKPKSTFDKPNPTNQPAPGPVKQGPAVRPAKPVVETKQAAEGKRAPGDIDWPMDRVTLNDGRSFRGLVKSISDSAVEFAEIRRPKGKPMFVAIWPIDRSAIVRIERLDEIARAQLAERIAQFANRTEYEAGRMEHVQLVPVVEEGTRYLVYRGPWFELESTADAAITRQFIVRLEQMFLAFRQVLPPQRTPAPDARLRIRVFGTLESYDRFLRAEGVPLRNPAYYDARQHLVVVGTDIRRLSDEMEQFAGQHQRQRERIEADIQNHPFVLQQLESELRAKGELPENWKAVVAAARSTFGRQQAEKLRALDLVDRANAKLLDERKGLALARLFHETFHAYLNDSVYPPGEYDVPRWLNEGLAQIFEAGLLEAETLRIDAPQPALLARLQADLRGPAPLPLAELLEAEPASFLVPHRANAETSARHYLYSWGLAWYLTFEQPTLDTDRFSEYVSVRAKSLPARQRFTFLVDSPLPEFEAEWRKSMLQLK